MRMRMYILFLLLLLLSTDIALGSTVNKSKAIKAVHSKHSVKPSPKPHGDRAKRSLDDDEEPFWPNRGKKLLPSYSNSNYEPPFWGTRGRRGSSEETSSYDQKNYKPFVSKNDKFCKNCYSSGYSDEVYGNIKQARDDVMTPFWGHRGRRSSEELNDNDIPDDLFWGSRGRRQMGENDPFWANRGRREADSPFWGQRGRRDEEPFWGNRGRREETPFWGHRGRRDEDNPFWGPRGRREDSDPFWGNRGRRTEDYEPFWGNRGRRKEESDPFWSSRGRRKEDLKESIIDAINDVESDIENLSRLRRSTYDNSFWSNRSRESKLKHLFNGPPRTKSHQSLLLNPSFPNPSEPGTVHDNRIYAEEPHYIIVERNSRSSGEVDPFYISRGKKYYIDLDIAKTARDRRGAIEEIVKSVRNDPYYIVRGKKDSNLVKIGNSTMPHEEFAKAKELICATVELIMIKSGTPKSKREIDDSERDRRTILKKLAAQLQMDPYFVSRGKKSDETGNNDDLIHDFINEVAGKCT